MRRRADFLRVSVALCLKLSDLPSAGPAARSAKQPDQEWDPSRLDAALSVVEVEGGLSPAALPLARNGTNRGGRLLVWKLLGRSAGELPRVAHPGAALPARLRPGERPRVARGLAALEARPDGLAAPFRPSVPTMLMADIDVPLRGESVWESAW